jgi:archaemetzincin
MADLNLVPIYLTDRGDLLDPLIAALEHRLHFSIGLRTPWFDPEIAFDASRGQYLSTILLKQLLDDPTPGAPKVLGVTGVDLFIPVLTYVFGEAQLNGRAAVISTHRLRPGIYGLPNDSAVLAARLEKEAVHELGHLFGLLHCASAACVMHSSTYVEEIDIKPTAFCDACMQVVNTVVTR